MWAARGNRLVSLTPAGVVHQYTVPINRGSVFTGITALAVNTDGQVAVGLSASNNLLVFNAARGTFSGHALPGLAGVNAIVALSDGRFVVGRGVPFAGLGDIDLVDLVHSDRVLATHAALAAGHGKSIVTDDGTHLAVTRVGDNAGSDATVRLPPLPADELLFPPVAMNAANTIVVGLGGGLATSTPTGWSQLRPSQPCPPNPGQPIGPSPAHHGMPSGPLPPDGTTAPTTNTNPHPVCPPTARAAAIDGAGHKWLLTTLGRVYYAP